ncbi:MAG: hypothetical protein IJU05_06925, partial [Schwartzia sp.]|nr:hypothetical protein [Schwartzia sp. (in: firmicutes)]
PSNAFAWRDKVREVNDAVAVSNYASGSVEQRRAATIEQVKSGYTPAQIASLKAAGFSLPEDDPQGKKGKFRDASGWEHTWPVLSEWYCGPEELKAMEKTAPALKGPSFKDVRGSAWLAARPDMAEPYIRQLDREIVAMKLLYPVYGTRWHNFNDKELRIALDTVGKAAGVDLSSVEPERLHPVGVGFETKWGEFGNWFGMQDLLERRIRPSKSELAAIYKNPGQYDLADQMYVVDELESQARALRSSTRWNNMTNVALGSIRFAGELWATGNAASTFASLSREGVGAFFKSIPRFLMNLGKQEVKRLPAYVIPKAAETFEELQSSISPVLENGAVLPDSPRIRPPSSPTPISTRCWTPSSKIIPRVSAI